MAKLLPTQVREEEIFRLISRLAEHSNDFHAPSLVLIGGYALKAFIPFSRSTRDCDFALTKTDDWLDRIRDWLPDLSLASLEKKADYGFMRCIKLIKAQIEVRVSLDFMEGKVIGREKEEVVNLDKRFEKESQRLEIEIANKKIEVMVPSYRDYFIMKAVSGRRSDVRDIAALVWKKGILNGIQERIKEMLPFPEIFKRKIEEIFIPEISDKRFVYSLRGTFLTEKFSEQDKKQVLKALSSLI